MVPESIEELRLQRHLRDKKYPAYQHVFFYHVSLKDRNEKRLQNISWTWVKACKDIGKPGALFHYFWRTGVRNLVRTGVPEVVAMRILGHEDSISFRQIQHR